MRLSAAIQISFRFLLLALPWSADARTLQESVQRLINDSTAEACDHQYAPQIQELAQALDERQEEIDAFAQTQTQDFYRTVTFGPTHVREVTQPRTPSLGWSEKYRSWPTLIHKFRNIRRLRTNAQWVELNELVRSMVLDDERRIIWNLNMYLDKDSEPKLASLLEAIQQCRTDTTCIHPVLSAEVEAFVTANPYFNEYWRSLSVDGTRNNLEMLHGRVLTDYEPYRFVKNTTVVRTAQDELTLPLDLGIFSAAESQFVGYIESIWSSPSMKVKVQSSNMNSAAGMFRFILNETPGGRPTTSFTSHVVNLFPDMRVLAIMHEIGHVLGLKDRYFTIWEPSLCRYRIQSNPADIMSNIITGRVTSESWQKLDEQYPVR